jgi:hypothetical protein
LSDVADNVLAKTNTARSHGRNPTLEELGGEETLLRHGAELASSEVAGTACLTIANGWDLVAEQDMALAFFGMAFRACGDSVVSEVVEAIATLPTMKAAQVAPALFSSLEASSNQVRAAYAGELLVTLATAEVVGWAAVAPALVGLIPQNQTWPAGEVNMRSVLRIALTRPDYADAAEAFLEGMAAEALFAADANFALGQLAFSRVADAPTIGVVDQTIEEALSFFSAALDSDYEHDDAHFMHCLTHVIRLVRSPEDNGELETTIHALKDAAGRIARFGSDTLTSSVLANSTRVAWVQAADLAARAAEALGSSHDRVSPYEILEAATKAQRFALAVEVGGEIWFNSIDVTLLSNHALIDAARRIVDADPAGSLADDLHAVVDRFEESLGKSWAGHEAPATIDELLDELADHYINRGMGTMAGLIVDLKNNKLLGTPEFDASLGQVLKPLSSDDQVSLETMTDVTLSAYFVLSYARRKTDATRAFGGFRDLANVDVGKPLEHHLQDDIGQAMTTTALGSGWTDERTNMSGGRADGQLVVGRTHIPFEFKAEKTNADQESLRKYVGQAERYTGGTAACAFLIVLDTTEDSARYNDIASQSWTVSIPSIDESGRPKYVITVVIPANMPSPSELSK